VRIAEEIRRLGAPMYLHARRLQHPSREGSWHASRELGGGALFDLFVHDVDFLLSVMGTDVQVDAANGDRGEGGSWRRVTAALRWPCGTCATVEASNMMPAGYPFTAALHVQYRNAAIDYSFRTAVNIERNAKANTELILYDGGAKALPLSPNAQEEAFKAQLSAFVRGARAGISPLPAGESVRVMQIVARVEQMLEQQ